MSYWAREIAGWLLVLAGLGVFVTAYNLLLNKRIFEAAPLVFIGFIVFRGGIHLLKVAVAAQAARSLPDAGQGQARRAPRAPGRAIGPTPAASVMPGPRSGGPRRQPTSRGRE